MSKILCITSGLTGILKSSVAMCKRLESIGHELVYGSVVDNSEHLQAEGLSYIQLVGLFAQVSGMDTPSGLRSKWRWGHFQNYVQKEDFDLVIIDQEVHEYILALHEIKYNYVLLSQWFPIWPNDQAPSPQEKWIPFTNGRAEADNMKSWSDLTKRRRWSNWKAKFSRKAPRRKALIKMLRDINYPMDGINLNGWPPPYHYIGKTVLTMNNSSLDFTGNSREEDIFLGAQIDVERHEVMSKVQRVMINQAKHQFGERKLILCTLSSMDASQTGHLNKIVKAVGLNEHWELWITLGGKSQLEITELPENVKVFDWLPQLSILESAAVCIHHGGIHTINECVHWEVPMLVYSGEKHDQNGCAARILHHGLGRVGDKRLDTSEQIVVHLEALINDAGYRKNLQRHAQEYRDIGKSTHLVDVVQSLINEG